MANTINTTITSIDTLPETTIRAFCRLYARYVKPSWINIFVQRNLNTITQVQLDPRLRYVYNEFNNSEYGFRWLRFGGIRLLMDPLLATKELDSDSVMLCGDTRGNNDRLIHISHSDATEAAALHERKLLEYVILQTLKHTPGDEIFGICDGFSINLEYRYNIDNPEPKTITLTPLRSPGRQHERKVHRYVLADVSERFSATVHGSGQIKAKSNITIDCDVRLLDWLINGIYTGVLDLSLIRKKQRKYAYKMLGETMIATVTDFGKKIAGAMGLKELEQAPSVPPQNYYDSDSDSD